MSRGLLLTKTLMLNLTRLTDLLSSTTQAILPARIQFYFLQGDQILSLNSQDYYKGY